MLSIILANKIFSLFLIMLLSMLMVRMKAVKTEDSKIISILLLYLFFPCVIIDAFQVDFTEGVKQGLLLSTGAAIVVELLLLGVGLLLKKALHLTAVESVSVIYSNAGNLVIPLVVAMLGPEWVIYTSTFLTVQLVLFFTHLKATLAREVNIDYKAMLINPNMLAIYAGFVLLLTGYRLPGPVNDACHSLGLIIGPSAMIIAGMLLGDMTWAKIKTYRKLPLVAFLRLVAMPLLVALMLKYCGLGSSIQEGETILLITLIATATPSATTIVSMASLYDNEPEYASVINVVTATLCVVTMPIMVWIYQL